MQSRCVPDEPERQLITRDEQHRQHYVISGRQPHLTGHGESERPVLEVIVAIAEQHVGHHPTRLRQLRQLRFGQLTHSVGSSTADIERLAISPHGSCEFGRARRQMTRIRQWLPRVLPAQTLHDCANAHAGGKKILIAPDTQGVGRNGRDDARRIFEVRRISCAHCREQFVHPPLQDLGDGIFAQPIFAPDPVGQRAEDEALVDLQYSQPFIEIGDGASRELRARALTSLIGFGARNEQRSLAGRQALDVLHPDPDDLRAAQSGIVGDADQCAVA